MPLKSCRRQNFSKTNFVSFCYIFIFLCVFYATISRRFDGFQRNIIIHVPRLLSPSLSLSSFISFSFSLSLFLHSPLSPSLSLSLSPLSLSLPLSISLSLPPPLSLSPSPSLSLSLSSPSLSLSPFLSFSLSPSVPLPLSLSLPLSFSHFLSPSPISLYNCISIKKKRCFSISIVSSLSIYLSISNLPDRCPFYD